ncbi:substrate-binding periplasmic protein [Roseateles violae]|uniref:Transporter substrate-binding domain-containing protein n=1 Tax=Roseateles violae TaxID=3058042 RepID=A0ABT8DTP7_9BURK|nr:transporter substrate-binding domain-containing protein [Pelomonas sp. PFR6]MDN3919694.1 transporter substrate-binding domain-containing protein [Pelomonas sp. PFR6]
MHAASDFLIRAGQRFGAAFGAALWLALFASPVPAAPPQPPLQLQTAQQSGSIGKYAAPGEAALPGICMEILRAVERVDPGLRFVGLERRAPLRRIERMLAQGDLDVFFCLLKTPERAQQWRYLPVPLYRVRHMVVQRIDDAQVLRSTADLIASGLKKPVLVSQGTVLQQGLARAGVVTAEAPSEREALQMLLLGRTDAVYGQDVNLLRNLRESGLGDKLRLSPTVFLEDLQYATVGRQLPADAEQRLTQALQALERDGTLKAIADKYNR